MFYSTIYFDENKLHSLQYLNFKKYGNCFMSLPLLFFLCSFLGDYVYIIEELQMPCILTWITLEIMELALDFCSHFPMSNFVY